ncbi:MAG TPA: hypothetical protein VG841_11240 [Caulobacterales bacterium]|nr:hypothetical protein [Caulobacterales bacterium]
MSDPKTPDPPETKIALGKTRLPFERRPSQAKGNVGKIALFALIAVGCAGAAGYGALVAHFPLTDMRVIAPGVGALWFALRIFMLTTPRL